MTFRGCYTTYILSPHDSRSHHRTPYLSISYIRHPALTATPDPSARNKPHRSISQPRLSSSAKEAYSCRAVTQSVSGAGFSRVVDVDRFGISFVNVPQRFEKQNVRVFEAAERGHVIPAKLGSLGCVAPWPRCRNEDPSETRPG